MKNAILVIVILFFLLMTMPSYAQKTNNGQQESKIEKLQKEKSQEKKTLLTDPSKKNTNSSSKNLSSKVEEKGIATPEHMHNPNTKSEESGLDVPDFMKNPNSETRIGRVPRKLTLENVAFQIKLNNNGFELYENGSSNVYAKLAPTQIEGLYRYTSSTINGAARFDKKGNLIMKYLNSNTGKMDEIQFQSK